MSKIRHIVELLDKGYIYYTGFVPESYYQERRCRDPKKAEWFVRPWSKAHKATRYICLGCATKHCTAVDPVGWQVMLPISKTRPAAVAFAPAWELTPDELLRAKKLLRVDEAAWVLNVGHTRIYDMIDSGELDAAPGLPVRVTTESVGRQLQPVVP